MRTITPTWRISVLALVVALAAGSCASDNESDVVLDDSALETTAEEATDPDTGGDEAVESDEATDEGASNGPDDEPAAEEPPAPLTVIPQPAPDAEFDGSRLRVPALGGVEFWVPDGLSATYEAERLSVFEGLDSYGVALISSELGSEPIESVEAYLSLLEAVPDAVVEPLGERLDLLGIELVGYSVEAPDTGPQLVYSFNPNGYFGPFGGSPFPSGVIFVGDTPNGVLEVGYGSRAEGGVNDGRQRPIFDEFITTLRLTGEPLDTLIDYGTPFEFTQAEMPAVPEPSADGPTVLQDPFRPVEAGSYQFNEMFNLLGVEIAEQDWWIQPFFPGFVVFAEADNPGPGQRDLTMLGFIDQLVPVSAGPGVLGEAIEFESADELLDIDVPGLIVEDLGTVTFGGGVSAVVLDISTDPAATCAVDDPCSYAMANPTGDVWPLRPHLRTRIWHVTGAESPFMIFAADGGGDWLDEVQPFIESMTFLG